MPDAGNPATQCHQYASGTPMGEHYSVEIENAEIILDIDILTTLLQRRKGILKFRKRS